jgi:hypothetical protein
MTICSRLCDESRNTYRHADSGKFSEAFRGGPKGYSKTEMHFRANSQESDGSLDRCGIPLWRRDGVLRPIQNFAEADFGSD